MKTYKVSSGRPSKNFGKFQVKEKYFDIQILNFDPESNRSSQNPSLCVGESLDALRLSVIRPYVGSYFYQYGSLKFSIVLRLIMERSFYDPNSTGEEIMYVRSFLMELNHMRDFDEVYNQHSSKIHEDFRSLIVNGSGWFLKNVTGVYVKILSNRPFRGGGTYLGMHLQVPWEIRNSNCVINIKCQDEDCFKYSILASVFHREMKERGYKPSNLGTYKHYLEKLDFTGINGPVKLSNEKLFTRFEIQNPNYALNILTLKTNEIGFRTNQRNQSNQDKRRIFNIHVWRTSPFINKRIPIYILLLYNVKRKLSHYCCVTKLEVLLDHNTPCKLKGKSVICMKCKQRFCGLNRRLNYEKHFVYCKSDINVKTLSRSSEFRNLSMKEHESRNRSICLNCHTCYEGGNETLRERHLKSHQTLCLENPPAMVKIPRDPILTFNQFKKQRKCPFVIHADTESLLANNEMKEKIDEIIHNYKRRKNIIDAEKDDDVDDEANNLHLEMFSSDESENGETEEVQEEEEEETERDYNVKVDTTPLTSADPPDNNTTLHNHEISGFSLNVVTLSSLQHHFLQPVTYSGILAGNERFYVIQ